MIKLQLFTALLIPFDVDQKDKKITHVLLQISIHHIGILLSIAYVIKGLLKTQNSMKADKKANNYRQ